MYVFPRMLTCADYTTIKEIFYHLCVVALTKETNDAVNESMHFIDALIERGNVFDKKVQEIFLSTTEQFVDDAQVYDDYSPFAADFKVN